MLTMCPHLAGDELVAALLDGTTEPSVVQTLVLPHLLELCADCRQAAAGVQELRRSQAHWSHEIAVSEGAEAPEHWQRLAGLRFADQLAAVATDDTLHTWGLARHLLVESRRLVEGKGTHYCRVVASQLAELAIEITGHLGSAYHSGWVADLRGLAFASLGHARRELRERASAAAAFAQGARLRSLGPTSPALAAEAVELEALLARDEGELAVAVELLDDALAMHNLGDADLADRQLPVRVGIHRAWCLYEMGQPIAAEAALAAAGDVGGVEGMDSGLAIALQLGMIATAAAQGRWGDVTAWIPVTRSLAARVDDRRPRLWLDLVRTMLPRGAGESTEAERALREARSTLCGREDVAREDGMAEALAILGRIEALLPASSATPDGAPSDALWIAEETLAASADLLSLLRAQDMTRDSVAIVLAYIDACKQGVLTRSSSRKLREDLEEAGRPSEFWWRLHRFQVDASSGGIHGEG